MTNTVDGTDDLIGRATSTGTSDILNQLVGDGKKFKSFEDLAKGKIEADSFIEKIKGENETLRTLLKEIAKSDSEDTLADLIAERAKNNAGSKSPMTNGALPNSNSDRQPATVDKEKIMEAVREYSRAERESANELRTNQILAEMFGEKAVAEVASRAKVKGVSGDVLKSVAKTSPDAFFAMLGIEVMNGNAEGKGLKQGGVGGNGSVNSDARAADRTGDVRNQAYYDRLKNEMGVRKFVLDRALQLQMHKDMQAQGDAFFG